MDVIWSPETNIRMEQENAVEHHMELSKIICVKDVSAMAASAQKPPLPPVVRQTKEKIRALHAASTLKLLGQNESSHDVDKRSKRNLKLRATSKSPYVIREVLFTKPTTNEMLISEYAFSGLLETNDIIFEHNGFTAQRREFECFHPELLILRESIDLWSHIMNAEEKKKSPDAHTRLFCHTSMMTEEMLTQSIDDGILFEKFRENMDGVLKCSEYGNLNNVDLVFFPIIQDVRFYLIYYNLCTQEYHILDNKEYAKEEDDINKQYDGLPKLLNELFCVYLSFASHPSSGKMNNKEAKVVRLRWRTKLNEVDCGIFTMRHMEMYQGELIKDFDPSLRKESRLQKNQLEALRRKYVAKMLMWNLNEKKSVVLEEAAEFNKYSPSYKKDLKKNAREKIAQRL